MKKPKLPQNLISQNTSNNHANSAEHLSPIQELAVRNIFRGYLKLLAPLAALSLTFAISVAGLITYSAIVEGSKKVTPIAVAERLIEDPKFIDLVSAKVPPLPSGFVVATTTNQEGTPRCPDGWVYLPEGEGRFLVVRKFTAADTPIDEALKGSQYPALYDLKGTNPRNSIDQKESGTIVPKMYKNNNRFYYLGGDSPKEGSTDKRFIGFDLCMKT